MTQKEKVNELKETIKFLYEKEGRSKSYISKLLFVDRKVLIEMIGEWNLIQGNNKYLIPSSQKFANKHKQFIKSQLDNDVEITAIASKLGVTESFLKNIISRTPLLKEAESDYSNRKQEPEILLQDEDFDGEEWCSVLGYSDILVSNKGRVMRNENLLEKNVNRKTGNVYVEIGKKHIQVARLVGFAFVKGYSKDCNVIKYVDGNPLNTHAENLKWVTGKECDVIQKKCLRNRKFKEIVLDDKYKFKTLKSFAKFMNVSETQASKYIDAKHDSQNRAVNLIY